MYVLNIYAISMVYISIVLMCTHDIYIGVCLLITNHFTCEWAREAYVKMCIPCCLCFYETQVNLLYSMFLCFCVSTEKTCASLMECLN